MYIMYMTIWDCPQILVQTLSEFEQIQQLVNKGICCEILNEEGFKTGEKKVTSV